jgi:predicted metal-binding protein
MELSQIENKIKDAGMNQYALIDPKEIPFSKEVRDMCKMNSCGRYNTNWQCPPAVGELKELEKRAKSYQNALLFNCVYPLEDSYDFEGMMAAKDNFTILCSDALAAVSEYAEDCYVMGAGGCNICSKCSYPNEKCLFPDKAIASMEACGIDVYASSGKFGFQYINGVNTVTYFGIVFFK